MRLTRLTARSRHGISRSIKREKLEKEGRKTTRRGACCVRIRPEQVFSSASLARATASGAWLTHVPRTSSRKKGVEEARSRLAGAGYSGSGCNSGPASSSCSGSTSGRSRAATEGASCASAAARFEAMGTFAGFRDLRSRFLLMPINKAHAITAKERPTATATIKLASASERRFGIGDPNDGEAVGEAVIELHGQISTECQAPLPPAPT